MKNLSVGLLIVLLIFTGCSDEITVFDVENPRVDLTMEENNTLLSNGIKNDSNGVLGIYFEHEISGKNAGLLSKSTNDFHLNLVGQVSRPAFDTNSNLTATHVDYQDNFAYVSYNTVGQTYAGAVDIIDLSNPLQPILASRMYMHDRDANIILYDNGYLYVLGSVDAARVFDATDESYIAKIGVFNGVIDLNDVNYFYQQGNTATGITKMDNAFFVSSGEDGSIAKYDSASFSKSNEITFDDLRSVASENGSLAVLDASTGVKILDSDLNLVSEISTSTNFSVDAKRTIALKDDQLFVPEGEQGTGVYNINTGALEERLPILVDPDHIAFSDKVTNGIAVNGNTTLMANGGAGLAIKVTNEIVDLMGVVELSGSINYVVADGDYVFAASGKSGLQIISKIRSDESKIIPEGNYSIRARHSSRALALTSLSTENTIDIVQQSTGGEAKNEQWNLEILDSGGYVIRSTYSNKVVQIALGSRYNNVQQGEYEGETSQQWAIEPGAEEGYFYIRNLSDNKYADVFGRRTAAGTTVITWPFHGRDNQQWKFERLDE
jgi:hypothetical protein